MMSSEMLAARLRWTRMAQHFGCGLGATALALALGLAGCGAGTGDRPEATTVEVTVTETVPVEPSSPEPTLDVQSTPSEEAVPAPVEVDDAQWFAAADYACAVAIEEYATWKAQAGDGAAPEALAIGAASAATRAADTIEALPEPMSVDALELRDAVSQWATSYRDLALAMDSGTYSEVISAGDATTAAADLVRGSSFEAPTCADMVHDV